MLAAVAARFGGRGLDLIGVAGQCSAGGCSTCQNREYVFTEWDNTAKTDMQALRSAFDSNGDGKLTAADTNFAKFKVTVTGANGSTSVQSMSALRNPLLRHRRLSFNMARRFSNQGNSAGTVCPAPRSCHSA